ncbi:lytic transglycosylase domain-containing protein [Paraburkholderia bannensis]|uniref:lytic transglycosylase domain-containing protein n=1 Tax=Paraburkholderia bannensis TaxID=765414 RepID=UPI002AB65D8D|nr:lytic transglycosylase domain-containing protein [Paraburkholderia bannensis]
MPPIDDLYADSTSAFLTGSNQVNVPTPPITPTTSIGSIARAVGRGIGQGATSLFGAAADTAAGLSQLYVDPEMLAGNPDLVQQADARVNAALAKASAGHLFESRVGTAAYDLADTLKADPTNSTTIDQVVQGAVSGLTQIVPAAVLGGPLAGAAVGGAAIGMGRAEDLKRQGVDVGTRTAAGAVEGAIGGAGAVLPVAGSTLARTAALVGIGGPGLSIAQGAAEKAILRNANYDGLADQINPLDPVNLAASTLVAGVFGGVHVALGARAAGAAAAGPGVPLTDMSVAARKALPYNSPALDAYATQAAQAAGVPPSFLLFIKNEGERSNSNQVSSAGAKGVMQFTKDTWAAYGNGDPTDPVNSIDAAAAYAKDLLQRYNGDMRAAVTEYNGGTEQARAVQAGGAPTAQETIDYLHRFDRFAATHAIDSATFSPTGDQVDAALKAQGQRIVDDAHVFGTPDDLTSTSAHQAAFEAAAQQMAAGRFPDVSSFVSGDDAARASTLDGMINDAESTRADLVQQASKLAERGGVSDARAELANLQASPPDTSDAAVKTLTRQIQSTGVKYKAATARAQKLIDAQGQEHADKIQRLQQVIQRNAEAQRANDSIAATDQQLGQLRAARAQIDVPQTTRRPLADFVQRLASSDRERVPAVAGDETMALDATSPNDPPAPRPGEPEQITRASLADNGAVNVRKAASSIEQRVRAALLEGRDVTLHSEGAQHRIVGFENGMIDSAGKQWTAMDLLKPPGEGEAPRLELGAQPQAAAAAGSLVESNLRQSAAENPDRRVTLDAPSDGSDLSSANPRAAAFDGPLQDALDLIDREHTETVSGAKLFRVAAQCFLSLGG